MNASYTAVTAPLPQSLILIASPSSGHTLTAAAAARAEPSFARNGHASRTRFLRARALVVQILHGANHPRRSRTTSGPTQRCAARFVKERLCGGWMKRILVGVDASPEAAAAADKAADLAQVTGASLQIMYVVPRHLPRGPGAYASDVARRDLVERDYVPGLLHELERRCRRKGVIIDSATATGPVAEALAEMASDFDMVVVGHRGRGTVASRPPGSGSESLRGFVVVALLAAIACAGPAGPPGPAGPGGPGGDAGTPGTAGPIDYGVLTPAELEVAKITGQLTGVTIPADGRPVVT